MHLVLLRRESWQEMHIPRLVSLHLQRARCERPLLTLQNMEVIICGVEARVALCAEGGAEDDQVLRNRRVYNVHSAHCAARVVEQPLRRLAVRELPVCGRGGVAGIDVKRNDGRRVRLGEVREDVLDHAVCVVWGGGYGGLREFMQECGIEDIPPGLVLRVGQRDIFEQ